MRAGRVRRGAQKPAVVLPGCARPPQPPAHDPRPAPPPLLLPPSSPTHPDCHSYPPTHPQDCELLDLYGRPETLLMTHLPVPPVCIRPRCALRMLRRRVMLGSGSRCGAAGMRAWDVGPRPARAPPSPGPAQVSVARFTWARLSDLSSMPTMLYLPHCASSAQPTPPTPTPHPTPMPSPPAAVWRWTGQGPTRTTSP